MRVFVDTNVVISAMLFPKGKVAYIASLSKYSTEKETLFINGTAAIIKEIRTELLGGGRIRYNINLDME